MDTGSTEVDAVLRELEAVRRELDGLPESEAQLRQALAEATARRDQAREALKTLEEDRRAAQRRLEALAHRLSKRRHERAVRDWETPSVKPVPVGAPAPGPAQGGPGLSRRHLALGLLAFTLAAILGVAVVLLLASPGGGGGP